MKKCNKLLFFLYPFRDSFGLSVGSTPFRVGEIYSVFYAMAAFTRKKFFRFGSIDHRVRNILFLLIVNFFLCGVVSFAHIDTIEVNFFQKYLLRNFLTILLIWSILGTTINYEPKLVISGIKWNIILQAIFAVIFFVFSKRIFMNDVVSIWDIQTASYDGIEVPRFAGTSSEAGYLGPLLAMPLYYLFYNYKKEIKWLICCLLLLIVTVSTFNFFIIVLTFSTVLFKKNRRSFVKFIITSLLFIVFIGFIGSFFFQDTILGTIIHSNTEKFIGYVTLGKYGILDWSASDRTQHLYSAMNMFISGNVLELLLGHGTGAYSFFASHNTNLMVQNVEEAYNIYLSTLTDRGIIGLIIFILIFYHLYKIKSDNLISDVIWFGIAIQLIHFMIVGNMWLYYFWQEVIFLIGFETYLKLYNNETQTYKRTHPYDERGGE